MKNLIKNALKRTGYTVVRAHAGSDFRSDHYLRHNARRLEHLASMGIPVAGKSVLEVGAGIGDHSHYYLDRGCRVTITEPRGDNLSYLKRRYPEADVQALDMDDPGPITGGPFEVVHCYGLLYHLSRPERAIEFMGRHCGGVLFLETCVSFGNEKNVNLIAEDVDNPTQAVSGTGCRPTRPWIYDELKKYFPWVYVPRTQPNHAEFPIDWTAPEKHKAGLSRAVFVASKSAIDNPVLSKELIDHQTRHA